MMKSLRLRLYEWSLYWDWPYFFTLKLKKYRTPKPIPRGGNRSAIIIKIRRSQGGLSFLEPGDGTEAQLQEFRPNTEGYCS